MNGYTNSFEDLQLKTCKIDIVRRAGRMPAYSVNRYKYKIK
jgi:hypothetical protein